jgi:hypothetical protein
MGKQLLWTLAIGISTIVCAIPVQAETFLLIIVPDEAAGISIPPDLLSAVEDGAYDAFFEARHICFNDGIWNKEYSLNAPQGLERAIRIAGEGGASKLLVLSLSATESGRKTPWPAAVGYSLYRVLDRRRLATGSVKAELKAGSAGEVRQEPEELCVGLGRQAVSQALSVSP